jgi:hypothetical protein
MVKRVAKIGGFFKIKVFGAARTAEEKFFEQN